MLPRNVDGSIPVPEASAPPSVIWEFALTYNAYARHGGSNGVADEANRIEGDFAIDGRLPVDLVKLRMALFFEQRRAHHMGEFGPSGVPDFVVALLEEIRSASGGSVEGPGDPWP